jgi:hypothetical protein
VALIVLGALVGFAMLRLARAGQDLRDAQDLVDVAATAIEDGRLADARSALGDAQGLVLSANNALYQSVEVRLLGWLPIARTNLESLRDSVGLAATVIDGGSRVLAAAQPLESPTGTFEVSLSDGTIPLEAVTQAEREISALSVQLPSTHPEDEPAFLLSQARELRTEVYDEAIRRRAQLSVLGHGLRLLEQLAGAHGPRRYLIAVANNAEMRGSGGMVLNYGVLEGRDGVVDLTAFGRIDELLLDAPVSDELVPDDYLARWAGFDALIRWRQANLAGDFTVVAPVLEAMYTAASGQPVDGVLQVDPMGLAAILDGVGPVVVPELGEVNGGNVVPLTLNEAYARFPGIEARSDVLGDVAEAAFRRLVDGEIPSLRTLATRVAEAAAGRHLVMHATTGRVQNELISFGADGAYPENVDTLALTTQNLAGNKLDYYLDTELKVTGELSESSLGELRAEVTLRNTAPAGATQPRYVFGPGPVATRLAPGVLRSLVTLYLPFGTTLTGASGDALVEPAGDGTEADRPYATFTVDVPAGEARTVVLDLATPPRAEAPLVVVPSATIRPTTLVLDVAAPGGTLAGSVELDRTWTFLAGGEPTPVPAPAFR